MPIAKIKHTCKPHEFQDKKYGKDTRVFTEYIKNNGGLRCTVCGAMQGK